MTPWCQNSRFGKKQTSSHRRVENDCSRDQRAETLHAGPQTGPRTTGQDNLGQKNRTQGSSSWSRYVFHRNRHVQSTENHRDVLRLDRRPRAGRGNRRLSGLFSFNSRSWRRKKKLQQSLWSLLFFLTYRELQPGLAVTKHQSCWVSKLWRRETLVLRPDQTISEDLQVDSHSHSHLRSVWREHKHDEFFWTAFKPREKEKNSLPV